ncbi:MAG: outer membrane lipid asymmetry maintenance protein MlaD [Caulobacter sp.]|jgi:phospholipid/cholesterol/gamma-HCH transport system substrate-binding protein
MRENWAETIVGALVLIGAGGFLGYLMLTGDVGAQPGGYPVKARFGQVGSLKEGDDVRVAGVRVGQVSGVTLDSKTYFAATELTIDRGVSLPSDSTAKVTSDGLLGGAHISIEPGAAEDMLKAGGEIENTQGAVDLFGLIGQVIKPAPAAAPAPATEPQ